MNRRKKTRLDLQLLCRVGANQLLSAPIEGLTENVSRDGMLIRWVESVPLPDVGAALTVDVKMAGSSAGDDRVMRCRTTVVRIVLGLEGLASVGLRIESVHFAKSPVERVLHDLRTMPVATERIS